MKRFGILSAALLLVALLAGCQSEGTTPTPPAANTNAAAAPAGAPAKPSGTMSTGLDAAPGGADTSLKGGMK